MEKSKHHRVIVSEKRHTALSKEADKTKRTIEQVAEDKFVLAEQK